MTTQVSRSELTPIEAPDLASRLGLLQDGEASWSGLGDLLRLAARRWRVASRRALVQYGDTQIEACGLAGAFEGGASAAIEALLALRDVERAQESGREVLVAAGSRVLEVTDDVGVLIGAEPCPSGASFLEPTRMGGGRLTRWVSLQGPARSALEAQTGPAWSLREWLGLDGHAPPASDDYVAHWRAQTLEFERRCGPVHQPTQWVVLAGAPGGYFGSHKAEDGRWRPGDADLADGLWLGASPGYTEHHWHPALVQVGGGVARRAMHLPGWSAAYTALRARGVAQGEPEILERGPQSLRQTCPLPQRARAAMSALLRLDGWRASGDRAVVDRLAVLFAEEFGLRVKPIG